MIGKRSKSGSLFDVGNVFSLDLKSTSFHAQLAKAAPTLFRDEEFALLYCANNGRPSVPPSLLALVLILQNHARVSDAEAIERTAYDLRWSAVLGRPAGEPLCAKSTLQMFRHHLVLHPEFRLILERSVHEAQKSGLIKDRDLIAALDTKPMLGRGAVEDTYNLLAQGMRQLARALVRTQFQTVRHTDQEGASQSLEQFLTRHDLNNLAAPSIKGTVSIDWSDEAERSKFLTSLVADARKLLALASGGDKTVRQDAQLLEQLLLQDVEESADEDGTPKAAIKDGTVPGRMPSATEPDQRHGRKSKSKRFTGHKTSIVTDVESGIILHSEILSGDAPDDTDALLQIVAADQTAKTIGSQVTESIGDCAYGSGATRQEFADAERILLAKVPKESGNKGLFPKSRFELDLVNEWVKCPGGKTSEWRVDHTDGSRTFYFDEMCDGCPLRSQCTSSKIGRSLHIHAQEAMLIAARLFQKSESGRAKLRKRLTVENALARLSWYGISQARYTGQAKCRFQLSIASAIANLRRSWNWMGRCAMA